MRFPWQGSHLHGASAPSAGVCHRCVTRLPGARVAERSDAPGAVETGRHRGMHPGCGRSRAAAARLRRDGGKRRRSVYAYRGILCDHDHVMPIGAASAYGIGTACPIPSRFSETVAIARESPL